MLHWFGKRLREMQEVPRDERGFTLIELLVVVIIIGVLAAIAIPVYLDQREQAFGATVQSDVRNGAAAAQSFAADNNGSFTGMTATGATGTGNDLITDYDWNLSPGVTGAGVTPTSSGNGFTLTATHNQANASENVCTFTSATGQIVCN